jgi:hypothetical protein
VFYVDIATVDRDVAHIIMIIHICFKCLICPDICCKCFYLDVVKVDLDIAYICIL